MKARKIWIFLVLISFSSVFCDHNVVDMVVSFLSYEEKPTSVLMFHSCWNKNLIKTMARESNKHGITVGHSVQRNRTELYLHHVIFVADLSCIGINKLLLKASDEGYFKSPYRWLLLEGDSLQVLDQLDMLVDSDVVVAKKINENDYEFVEAYKISPNDKIIFTTRSMWRPKRAQINTPLNLNTAFTENVLTGDVNHANSTIKTNKDLYTYTTQNTNLRTTDNVEVTDEANGTVINDSLNPKSITRTKVVTILKHGIIEDFRVNKVMSIKRKDLRGHVLTIVNVIKDNNDSRNHMDDRLQLHQDSIAKLTYMAVKICFEMLNATENRIYTSSWGYKDKDGNWQGVVEHLLKKEADLGTIMLFTLDRMNVIDYIAMVGSTAARFVFREPPLAYMSNIYTLPFTSAVWLAILVCALASAIFLYIASKWEASMSMHPQQLDGSWADVLILIVSAVLQQGCSSGPRHAAGRCVTLLLFLALTLLYAAYSANIVVLLRAPSSSVRTLKDLLNSPMKCGASDFEYNRYFFKNFKEPIRKAIYDKKIAPKGEKPNFFSKEEGIAKVRKGLFAFHMELDPGYRLIQETYQEDEKCDLVDMDYINEIDPWVPGQKRSPFKELFKINFMKIRESGLQTCIDRRLHIPKPKCMGEVSKFSSVGIADMLPALLATLYGMLMAPAVLLMEIAFNRLQNIGKKRSTLRRARSIDLTRFVD